MVNPLGLWPRILFGTRLRILLRGLSGLRGIGFRIPLRVLSGFRVPPGLVITAQGNSYYNYEHFLVEVNGTNL